MKTLTLTIAKENRKQAWGEHITEAGFDKDVIFDRRNKKFIIWNKDGVDYTASTNTDENTGILTITLTEYKSN